MSDALAVTLVVPETIAPFVGAVIDVVGAVVSLFTVTFTAADALLLPAASYAIVVNACAAFVDAVVFQLHAYGEVVSVDCSAPSR